MLAALAYVARFLSEAERPPRFSQPRLDELIEKSKSQQLPAHESDELRRLLDFVDDKSIEMLVNAMARRRTE